MINAPLVITSSQDVKIATIKTHVIYVMLISTESKSYKEELVYVMTYLMILMIYAIFVSIA
jgi:hypothetical protein